MTGKTFHGFPLKAGFIFACTFVLYSSVGNAMEEKLVGKDETAKFLGGIVQVTVYEIFVVGRDRDEARFSVCVGDRGCKSHGTYKGKGKDRIVYDGQTYGVVVKNVNFERKQARIEFRREGD